MFCSELLLAGSLLTFQAPRVMLAAKHMAAGRPSGLQLGAAAWWRNCALDAVVISLLYVPMHIFCAAAALTFLVLPSHHAAALWVGGLFVYYSLTSFGQPEHTGRREWPAMQAWLGAQLERFLPAWLGEGGSRAGAGYGEPARMRCARVYASISARLPQTKQPTPSAVPPPTTHHPPQAPARWWWMEARRRLRSWTRRAGALCLACTTTDSTPWVGLG